MHRTRIDLPEKTRRKTADLLNARCWLKGTRNLALDTALRDCTRSIELSENPEHALDSRAMVYFRLNRLEEAVADLDAALDAAPEQAASRECHEEIGLVPETVVRLGAMFPTPGYCSEEMIFFRVSGLSEPSDAAEVDEDEHFEVRTFTLREARDMVRRGEIVDMKTVVGLSLL